MKSVYLKVLGGLALIGVVGGIAYYSSDSNLFKGFFLQQDFGSGLVESPVTIEPSFESPAPSLNDNFILPEFDEGFGVKILPTFVEIFSPFDGQVMDNASSQAGVDALEWSFDWSDVANASRYEIVVEEPGASRPFIREFVSNSEYKYSQNYAAVTAGGGWLVKVRAEVNGQWMDYAQKNFVVEDADADISEVGDAPYISDGGNGSFFEYGVLGDNTSGITSSDSRFGEFGFAGDSGVSNGFSFGDSSVAVVQVPRLIAPTYWDRLNNDVGDEWVFKWDPVLGAESYEIEILGKNNFRIGKSVNTNEYKYSLLSYIPSDPVSRLDGWKWRVRAKVNGKSSDWSEFWWFGLYPSEEETRNLVPRVISPLTNEYLDNGNGYGESLDWPEFKWEPITWADKYHLYLNNSVYTFERDQFGNVPTTWKRAVFNGTEYNSQEWSIVAEIRGVKTKKSQIQRVFLEESGADSCARGELYDKNAAGRAKCKKLNDFKVTYSTDRVWNADNYIFENATKNVVLNLSWIRVPNVKAYEIFIYAPNGEVFNRVIMRSSGEVPGLAPPDETVIRLDANDFNKAGGRYDGWSWKVRAVTDNDGKSLSSDPVRFDLKRK